MTSKYFRTGYQFLKSGLGGTKKADQIKKSNQILKDLKKTMQKDMSPELKSQGEKLKKEVQETKKEVYKSPSTKGFKKGGRIGFKKGTGRSGVPAMDIKSTPTKKLSEKQKKIAMLAGDPRKIDKPDFAKLRSKNKKKVI